MKLAKTARQAFQEEGFIIVDNALSFKEIKAFQENLWGIIVAAHQRCQVLLRKDIYHSCSLEEKCSFGLLSLRAANAAYPLFVQAVISRSPEYYRLCSSPKIMNMIRRLRGGSAGTPIYLTNNGIIFTNPHDSENKRPSNIELDWHKDTFYTIPRSQFIHVWAPVLHDATKEIGTLELCPGSHKDGLGHQLINAKAPYDHRYTANIQEIKKYKPVSVEVKLGQALIFDGNLYHKSGKNVSRYVRCTLIGLHHDIKSSGFAPLSIEYRYTGQTPEGYYHELYGSEDAKSLSLEQAILK